MASNRDRRRGNRPRIRSQYTGVRWDYSVGANGMWRAQINVSGKSHYLGVFSDEKEAALAYDKAIIELRGEHLKMNFKTEESANVSTR